MREEPDNLITWSDNPPRPAPGFEADVLREVEGLVRSLPHGVARMRIGRIPGHPEWSEPDFEITPTNPKAARLGGYAVGRDLYLTIGEASREFIGFARGGTVARGATWQQEMRWIWQAVIAGGFIQHHYLDSRGQVIAWAARLVVSGKDLVFRNGRREKLFGRAYTREEIVRYEPYF